MNTPAGLATAAALVLAPGATIRVRDGNFHLQATGSQSFSSPDARLILWVAGFARPRHPDELLGGLAPAERQPAAALISRLVEIGVLVPAGRTGATDSAQDHRHATERLAALAQVVYDLSCDLRGFGPWAHAQLAGSPLTDRLASLQAAVEALRADLSALRSGYVSRQLAALNVSGESQQLKLHIGSGGADLPGWVNIDVHPAPLAMNLDWGLPFAAGSARYVFLSHLLEHLFYPQQALRFLAEIARVLEPGGAVRIVVPDIEQCLRAYVAEDREFFAERRKTWTWWPDNQTRLEDFLAYAGAGPNPAYLFESHKFGYDFETLARALERSGFTNVRRCGYMQSPQPELRVDEASAVAGARHGEQHYSLFVEAVRAA